MTARRDGYAVIVTFAVEPACREAFRDAILRISALLGLCPEIQELDVNPLKVLPGGVSAVDVRIRIEPIHRAGVRAVP